MENKKRMPRKKFYTKGQLEATRRLLQEAAIRGPGEPDRYTTPQIAQQLNAEFDNLRRQGFTNIQIAELMSQGLGEVLGASTLQKFFSPTKRRKRKKPNDGENGQTATTLKPKPTPVQPGHNGELPSVAKPHDARNQNPTSLRERS